MNVNDMPDGFGRDPWLYNDSLYHEEDNPRFKSLDDYDRYDERELEVRKESIRKLEGNI
jgi:hypothetical protein